LLILFFQILIFHLYIIHIFSVFAVLLTLFQGWRYYDMFIKTLAWIDVIRTYCSFYWCTQFHIVFYVFLRGGQTKHTWQICSLMWILHQSEVSWLF